jgi:hypothetical protein
MDELYWSNKKPTTPGFYYWQGENLKSQEVAIIQVYGFKDKNRPLEAKELSFRNHHNTYNFTALKEWSGIWAGPLPQPKNTCLPNRQGGK